MCVRVAEMIPRSLLICVLEGVCYLLCALGDGSMFYFTVDRASGALSNKKKVTLGTQPTVLKSFRSRITLLFGCCCAASAFNRSCINMFLFVTDLCRRTTYSRARTGRP